MSENCHIDGCQRRLLVAALEQCAAPFATPPGSVAQCQDEISREFQRRMDIAGEVLLAVVGPSGSTDVAALAPAAQ